jgi:hypothetical protein
MLAAATAVGALFALPAAANAAATVSFTGGPTGTAVAGDTVNYTLHIDVTSDFNDVDTLSVSTTDFEGTIGAMSVVTTDNNDDNVTFAGDEIILDADIADADGDINILIPVTRPTYYESNFRVEVEQTDGTDVINDVNSSSVVVSKGGPSDLRTHVTKIGANNKWVTKGADTTGEVTVTNVGTGAAYFVDIYLGLDSDNNEYLSPTLPNPPNTSFAPQLTIAAGTCSPTSPNSCAIAELAPGATVTIPVTITKLTHFGWITIEPSVNGKADGGFDRNYCGNGSDYNATTDDCDPIVALDGFTGSVDVTDGTTIEPHVGIVSSAVAAAGNADVSFTGAVSAAGSTIAAGSVLVVSSTSFKNNQPVGTSYEGDAGVSQSIQSVTVPGAICANYVNPGNSKKQLDRFVCTLPAISAGSRVGFSVGAKFATTLKNLTEGVDATLYAPGYFQPGSASSDSASLRLNVDKTSDISVVAKSAALVGASNVTPIDVIVTNTGNTKARTIGFTVTVPGAKGSFGDVDQNAACSVTRGGFVGSLTLQCGSGELAAGASRKLTIWVTAGKKLGSMPLSISAYHSGDGLDVNPDNDWVIQNLTIVKKSMVKLLGVKASKAKALKKKALLKAGFKTVVSTPVASVVKVDIVVTGKVAKQLGLIKKASKKDVVIGTKKVKTKKGQKVTVTTKLSLKYKAKVAKIKKKFTAKRVVTVVSTDRKSNGASSLTSANMPIK